jgi:anti-sigma factor RsiW
MLNDYVDGDVDPAVCEGFESHLAGCNPCRVVVDTIRGTISLYRGEEVFELPAGFRDRLHRELRKRWRR